MWIYEAFKVVNKDIDFDKPYTDKPSQCQDELLIYECLMFNDDREDSLFVMQNGVLYEYFSENKSELILKLIQYYENRLKNNLDESITSTSQAILKTNYLTPILNRKFKFNDTNHVDPELKFKSTVKVNILLVYKDGNFKWIYNYELKKLMFYFKFLPKSKMIKFIRLFPLSIQSLDITVLNYVDRDDQFIETKEAQLQRVYEDSKKENQLLKKYVKKIKTVFYDKYLLNLKKMDIHCFLLDGRWYLLDIKNFIFEKFENKHVKLDSEGLFFRYVEKYKDSVKLLKNQKKLGDVKIFYDSMVKKYDDLFHHVVSDDYLNQPKRDPTSDKVYHILKPESPYKLSTLMTPRVKLTTFVEYTTDNLWNVE